MNNTRRVTKSGARVKRPERSQIEWRPLALDQLLPPDHRARVVWRYVESLDLSALYAKIDAVEGQPGRDAVDPQILLALWMFATIEGISSGRRLALLCERDLAYMWICGGVGVNYHLLNDFRAMQGDFLDDLLTDTISTLMHQGLVTLEVVGQDGMRVRANAGSSSFRRRKTLEKCRKEAREHIRKLREEADEADPESGNARRKAAQKRAAEDRERRIEKALEELAELEKQKEQNKKGDGEKARCSTTDPEARNMKMGDGGFRPALNVQFLTDGDKRLIVAVDVTSSGSDQGNMSPMHQQVRDRYGKTPDKYLVDGGFVTNNDITEVEQSGSEIHAPINRERQMREKGKDPHARQRRDSDEMFAFRQRMATDEAKELFKQRPSIAEYPNAECRNRGLHQFPVRGLGKARAVALWHAITFNFMRMLNLGFIN